jgi:hypothetical protein
MRTGKSYEDLRQQLKELTKAPIMVFPATVNTVNTDNYTIDVTPIGGTDVYDVRLKAGIDSIKDGIVEIPTQGSTVLIGLIGNDKKTAFVVKASQVDQTIINGGNNGGIPVSSKIQVNLDQINDYLIALKDAVHAGLNAVGEGSAASGSAASAAFDLAMTGQSIDFENMEDTKITH